MTETTDPGSGPADHPGPGDAAEGTRAGMSHSTRSAIEWVAVIVGALVVALVVKTFLIQAFYIPSESMVPTLEVGDRVLVNKLSYSTGDIDRGDIVVFARPGGPGSDGIEDLIKRVVALPGETVEGRGGQVLIDGRPLAEPYLPDALETSVFPPYVVPEDHVWLMGDNRGASDDSRRFKAVPTDDIVGRAFVVIWPFTQLGTL
ncbi:signal peptidase I [Acidimicrobiia bacterium EGI L10123]|uniref:signal peptidase I n=1 Tax=Salinilacustrithrix flava TaxID=2957203 RepID=UPI003D7C2273|nr:signal peptidase I [Acidimicrobiia bacterium EGI L10123]